MARTGRPKTAIDLEQSEKLGALQCTLKEAAAFLNVAEGTLKGRQDFQTVFKKGQDVGKISLRRTQFRLAESSAAMAIFLGKNYLGQVDTPLIDQSQHSHYVVFRNPEALKENAIRPRAEVKDAQLSPR